MKEIGGLLEFLSNKDEINEKQNQKVVFVSFRYDTETIQGFLLTFQNSGFEKVIDLVYASKILNENDALNLKNELDNYAKKVYQYIPETELDYFNKSIESSKFNMGSIEIIDNQLKEERIEQFKKLNDYFFELDNYYKKLLHKKSDEKYIKEISTHLKSITDSTEFQVANQVDIDVMVKDIYYLSKKIADKNVFEFGFLDNHSANIQFFMQSLASRLRTDNGRIDAQSEFAIAQYFDIYASGFDNKKLSNIIKRRYKETDTLMPTKTEKEIALLEENLQYRYQSKEAIMKGFTYSKERLTYSENNLFEIIVEEIAKAAIISSKVNCSHDLYENMKEVSKNNAFSNIIKCLKEYMQKDKFNIKGDWIKQLDEISQESKKEAKKMVKPKLK